MQTIQKDSLKQVAGGWNNHSWGFKHREYSKEVSYDYERNGETQHAVKKFGYSEEAGVFASLSINGKEIYSYHSKSTN